MADKTNFSAEEWTQLLESPMMVGMAVTAADPSGLWGVIKEAMASGVAVVEAARDPSANTLVKAVAAEFATSEGRGIARDGLKAKLGGSKPADIKATTIHALRSLSAMLDAKAPDDAAAFKDWLRLISQRTADAASEGGGFLGFGGVQVSEAEKATLSELSTALGLKVA